MQISHTFFKAEPTLEKIIEVPNTEIPFTELMLSWNGIRPKSGFWSFSVSLFQNKWSDWVTLAVWGKDLQKTFSCNPFDSFAKSHQDVALVVSGSCNGYKVRIQAIDGSDLTDLHSITVSFGDPKQIELNFQDNYASVILSEIHPQSQQILPHPRSCDLCSPTSTAAAVNYLLKRQSVDPVEFAARAHDQTFDIYGNWILNTAAAYESLDGSHHTYVTRLKDFGDIHSQLLKGLPVVVSIKGPLQGAARPYASGHLILVIGYDNANKRVLCMDPAFPSTQETLTSYPLEQFLLGWTTRRKNLSYLFQPKRLSNTDF